MLAPYYHHGVARPKKASPTAEPKAQAKATIAKRLSPAKKLRQQRGRADDDEQLVRAGTRRRSVRVRVRPRVPKSREADLWLTDSSDEEGNSGAADSQDMLDSRETTESTSSATVAPLPALSRAGSRAGVGGMAALARPRLTGTLLGAGAVPSAATDSNSSSYHTAATTVAAAVAAPRPSRLDAFAPIPSDLYSSPRHDPSSPETSFAAGPLSPSLSLAAPSSLPTLDSRSTPPVDAGSSAPSPSPDDEASDATAPTPAAGVHPPAAPPPPPPPRSPTSSESPPSKPLRRQPSKKAQKQPQKRAPPLPPGFAQSYAGPVAVEHYLPRRGSRAFRGAGAASRPATATRPGEDAASSASSPAHGRSTRRRPRRRRPSRAGVGVVAGVPAVPVAAVPRCGRRPRPRPRPRGARRRRRAAHGRWRTRRRRGPGANAKARRRRRRVRRLRRAASEVVRLRAEVESLRRAVLGNAAN